MLGKNIKLVLILISLCFVSLTLNGMDKRKGKSDSSLKTKYLEVVGVPAHGDGVILSDRPHSSLGDIRSKSNSTQKRKSPIIRTPSQHSARADDSVDKEKMQDTLAQHLELRPVIHSVAERDQLGNVFRRWYRYVTDRKANLLNKLVSPLLRTKVLSDGGLEGLRAGKRVEMAVLFCDIRNFTSITELNDPESIMGMLNEYFGSIVKIISKHGGVVDKFIGDAVLAEYFVDSEELTEGYDVDSERHKVCENAVQSALEIIEFTQKFDVAKFNLKDDTEHPYLSDNKLQNGIGISFGNVVFGALGGEDRYELTIIGDEVNLASRLQDLNKNPNIAELLERPIIISERVHNLLSLEKYAGNFRPLGEQRIKGKKDLVNVFGYGKVQLDAVGTSSSMMVASRHFKKKS